jgi:hypothetical protein
MSAREWCMQLMDLAATIVDHNLYIGPNSEHSIQIWTEVARMSENVLELLSDEPNRGEGPLNFILPPNYSC